MGAVMETDDLILRMEMKLQRDKREQQEERIRKAREIQERELAKLEAAEEAARAEHLAQRREQIETELMEGVIARFGHIDHLEIDEVQLERTIEARLRREGLEP